MKEEIILLKKNNIWILVKQPSNKRLVGCKWIFKLKERISSVKLLRYKVTQREVVDFNKMLHLWLNIAL